MGNSCIQLVGFKFWNDVQIDNDRNRLRLSVTNALDVLYVSDATNNSQYAANGYELEGGSGRAEVFVGPPRMVRLSAVLELKGLQNRTPKE